MPKLLPHLRDDLLHQAQLILQQEGYSALSIRSLAQCCHVATGTIYNYFSSKDSLVAQIMMADWKQIISEMNAVSLQAPDFPTGMLAMYHALDRFASAYRATWVQFAQNGGSSSPIIAHHPQLRDQLKAPIDALMQRTADPSLLCLAPLLAETLLAAAVQPDLDEHPLCLLVQRLSIPTIMQQRQEE